MYNSRYKGSERAFNEQMHQVQQQFLRHRENTSYKLEKLEEMIELATQKMSLLRSIQAKEQEKGFVTSAGWKVSVRQDKNVQPPGVIPDSGYHLELRLPYFEGAEVFAGSQDFEHQLAVCDIRNKAREWPNHTEEEKVEWKRELPDVQKNKEVFKDPAPAAWETYTGEPMYDEEPGEGQECWPEKDFILAALKGGDPNFPNPLPSEVCTSERSQDSDDPLAHMQVTPQSKENSGTIHWLTPSHYYPEVDRPQHYCKQKAKICMDLVEVAKGKDQQGGTQICLGERSKGLRELSNQEVVYDLKPMITFDPVGYVQNTNSPGVTTMFKGIIRYEVTHDEGAKLLSAGDQLRRLEDDDASRKGVLLTIFDPGG